MNTSDPNKYEFVNSLLAVAAFLLSLYNFIVAQINKKPNVKVTLSRGGYKNGQTALPGIFFIEATNSSAFPIYIKYVRLCFGRKNTYLEAENITEDNGINTILSPNENKIFWVSPTPELKNENEFQVSKKIKIFAIANDTLGKSFRSNKLYLLPSVILCDSIDD